MNLVSLLFIQILFKVKYLQLLIGGSDDLLKRLNISRQSDQYFYVKQGNAARVDSINDKILFRDMTTSLNTLQVSS